MKHAFSRFVVALLAVFALAPTAQAIELDFSGTPRNTFALFGSVVSEDPVATIAVTEEFMDSTLSVNALTVQGVGTHAQGAMSTYYDATVLRKLSLPSGTWKLGVELFYSPAQLGGDVFAAVVPTVEWQPPFRVPTTLGGQSLVLLKATDYEDDGFYVFVQFEPELALGNWTLEFKPALIWGNKPRVTGLARGSLKWKPTDWLCLHADAQIAESDGMDGRFSIPFTGGGGATFTF